MPTLGEFVARARAYGYTKQVIRIRELHARIIYLRRGVGELAELVDLPPIREGDRLITEARAAREWYRLRNEDAGNAFMAELDAAIEHIDSLSSWCIGKRPPGSRSWRSRTHDGALGIGLDASNLTRRLERSGMTASRSIEGASAGRSAPSQCRSLRDRHG